MIVTLFGGSIFLCKMLPAQERDSEFISKQTNLSDSNGIRTHNNSVCKQTLYHLAKLAK